jgi:DNA-binding YbaB/EbfC family protein
MANPLGMMKKAAAMQRQMKKMQKQLAKRTVEVKNGMVTVIAAGDMTIKKITIDPEAIETKSLQQVEKMIAGAVNSGLDSAKKMAGAEMSNMSGGLGGLADMLGG